MKKGVIAIYEEDIAYANRLMDFLNEKEEFLLEAMVFSKKESLQEYLQEHEVDILLLGEFMDRTNLKEEHIKYKIVLCEGILVKEEETEPVINKYQSAECIMREILAFYVSKETTIAAYRYLPKYRKCEMISVYSPCGGCGKTTTALLMAQILGSKKRVLYFNLEIFPGVIFGTSPEGISGFSELVYYLKQRKSNLAMKLQTLVRKEGNVDLLQPAGHYNDLYALEVQDMQLLIEELYGATVYDVVIFDIGFISDATMELLEASRTIYMPSSENQNYREKEERFFQFIREEGRECIQEKCKKLQLPEDPAVGRVENRILEMEKGVLVQYLETIV